MFARIAALLTITLVLTASVHGKSVPASPTPPAAWPAACEDFDEWDKPGPPFRVHGNTYYVGTCGIAAILITGERGHILIDGGTEKGGAMIAANVERLGFRLRDVKLLLHSHEHIDHVGGLALLQQRSGAKLVASAQAAPVLASGIASSDDPQAGMHAPFPAAKVSSLLAASGKIVLGRLRLTALATPGHTPGALSWQWQSCEAGKQNCRWLVYADSLTPISSDSYRFSDHPSYVAAFRAGISRLAVLNCDILLTPHPSSSEMRTRLLAPSGLVDQAACRTYAANASQKLSKRLATEAGAK